MILYSETYALLPILLLFHVPIVLNFVHTRPKVEKKISSDAKVGGTLNKLEKYEQKSGGNLAALAVRLLIKFHHTPGLFSYVFNTESLNIDEGKNVSSFAFKAKNAERKSGLLSIIHVSAFSSSSTLSLLPVTFSLN